MRVCVKSALIMETTEDIGFKDDTLIILEELVTVAILIYGKVQVFASITKGKIIKKKGKYLMKNFKRFLFITLKGFLR